MAVTTSFSSPGVYITETTQVPHAVSAATTSFTAFLGLYEQGPTDAAVHVTSWQGFVEQFGEFDVESTAPYAVFQFFQNGGTDAWIVRLAAPAVKGVTAVTADPANNVAGVTAVKASPGTVAASVTVGAAVVTGGTLVVSAASPGAWATGSLIAFTPAADPLAPSGSFDFSVLDPTGTTTLETIPSLPESDLGAAAEAITNQSSYVTAQATETVSGTPAKLVAPVPAASDGSAPATPKPVPLAGGDDGSWSPQVFADAAMAELGFSLTAPAPTPRLDQIAPAVFNILVIPDAVFLPLTQQKLVMGTAMSYSLARQAFVLVDPPPPATGVTTQPAWATGGSTLGPLGTSFASLQLLLTGDWGTDFLDASNVNAATYYPWLQITDPSTMKPTLVAPSGTIAGVYAANDVNRGVWKAPAGVETALQNVDALADITITDAINGELNVRGINVLRTFLNYGNVVWGARTLSGGVDDAPFKYVSVRRLTDYIEQSMQQSLKWAVFEPNGPGLWAALNLEATAFMSGLFGLGAFAGASAATAYQVACDATTTSPLDQQMGRVNLNIAFAAVDPAEFVVVNVTLNAATGTN